MLTQIITARYFDGISSKPYSLDVHIHDAYIELFDTETGIQLDIWHKGDVKLLIQTGAQTNVKLSHFDKPDARLIILDQTGRDILKKWLPKESYPKHYEPSNASSLVGYGIITAIILYGLYISFPFITNWIAYQVPQSWEQQMGDSFYADIQESMTICEIKDTSAEKSLNKIVETLSATHNNRVEYQVSIVASKQVNAFALPGNKILLMDGLLQKAQSPDEIAAVLAHEIGHVHKRHVVYSLVKGQAISILLAILTGNDNSLITSSSEVLASIANLHNNRAHEYEADNFAVELMNKAQLDNKSVYKLLEILKGQEKEIEILKNVPEFLLSHPDTEKRIQNVKKLISQAPKKTYTSKPILNDKEWGGLKSACHNTARKKENIIELITEMLEKKTKELEKKSKK